jgi:uncharacterized protein YndB with AHSA1/START domain
MTVDRIERTIELPHPPERVWQALTEPAELSRWFSDRVHLDPRDGGEIMLEWDEFGRAGGVIEIFEPPYRFAFRWRAHGVPEEEPLALENSTLVTFTLIPTLEGTRLELVETGFASLPESVRAQAYGENVSGWQAELDELVVYLEPA